MKRSKILSLILAIALAFTLAFAITSCNEEAAECTHVDAERDGVCDKCGKPSGVAPCEHTDLNKDKKCDACGADYTATCTDHVSADADAKCDYCGADIVCTECVDSNSDGACDKCGKAVEVAATGSVELVKDGEVKFQFVLANEYKSNSDIVQKLDKLISTINEKKASVERVADTAATEKAVEILIGAPTSRGEAYMLDGHTLGYNGYSITVIETKVLVLAGSADALSDAIDALEEDVLKISKKGKTLPDSTLTEKNSILEMPDKYNIDNVLIAGNDLGDYVIAVDNSLAFDEFRPKDAAVAVQKLLYEKVGIWLPIVNIDAEYEKAMVFNVVAPELASTAGFKVEVKNGNINIECGFPNKLNDAVLGFVRSEITNKKQPTLSFNENYSTTINVRDIKYSETFSLNGKTVGGAIGDGINDDYIEIMGVHEYANKWGHTVNAVIGKTYYFGFEYAKDRLTIPVKTNVNWSGAKFIFDDTVVPVEYWNHAEWGESDGKCDRCGTAVEKWETTNCNCNGNGWHSIPIFSVLSDYELESVKDNFAGKALPKNSTNIGWEPGKLVLMRVYNSNIKQFIRHGVNENSGSSQNDIILVHPNGDIDPTTPLHWDYEVITDAYMRCVEDTPITLEGGVFTTKANLGPNYYYAYGRNIKITRSNVTAQNMIHYMDEDKTSATVNPNIERCPYAGFLNNDFTNNTTYKNITVTHHTSRYDKGSGALLGTYEFLLSAANDIKWIGIRQTNFFEDDGSVSYKGLFGSNYCKNFYFEDCELTSMDAHSGLYNATVIDSTFEHLNFIGEGAIYIKNLTVYADATGVALKLRADYGSTWNGTLTVDGMDVRYSKSLSRISLLDSTYIDWWFGFETYLPHTIKLNNVKMTKYSQVTVNGERTETKIGENLQELHLLSSATISNYINVNIGLWKDPGKNPNGETNGGGVHNIYHGTKRIELTNCGTLKLTVPNTPQFAELEYYIDGVLYNWNGK